MLTKRGFDAVLMTILAFNLAAGLVRMSARRWVADQSTSDWQTWAGDAVLQATS